VLQGSLAFLEAIPAEQEGRRKHQGIVHAVCRGVNAKGARHGGCHWQCLLLCTVAGLTCFPAQCYDECDTPAPNKLLAFDNVHAHALGLMLMWSATHVQVVVGRPLESPALRLADSASDITPVKDQGSRGQSKGCAKDARVAVYLAALQRLLKESAPQTVAPARGDTKVSLLSAQ
jgi:hypothetical protein